MKTNLLILFAIFGLFVSIPYSFASESQVIQIFQPDVELLPDQKIVYGESFTIHAWLPSYDNRPDDLGFHVDVLDPQHNQVDSTLWFAKSDFIYEFDTTHPAYNITKSGTYQIKIEKADLMQRTGIFLKTIDFEILFPEPEQDEPVSDNCGSGTIFQDGICVVDKTKENPSDSSIRWGGPTNIVESPLKQIKTGIYGNDIQCRDERVLVLKKSSELYSCIKPETVPKLFARDWALNEVEIIDTDTAEQGSKLIKITGVIDRLSTPEGFEYHLIPLREELPRIEYTGYNTLNLFSTKDTAHYFLRNLEGSLVKVEGRFLLDSGEYFRHFSGFPTIPVQKLEVISEPENLEYSIEGAEILSITKVPDVTMLNIVLQETQKGTLEITIPRDLIDTKIGTDDDSFFVLVDGIEVDFDESSNNVERTLTIEFEKNARTIQVIGSIPL